MLFLVLLSTAAVIATTFSLPTRTEPAEENDYRIALYRDANRKSGERQIDPLGFFWIPADEGISSNWGNEAKNERRQTSLDGGNSLDFEDNARYFLSGTVDKLGGGHLLGRAIHKIGGGHLVGRDLDKIGGGHLLGRGLDKIGGGHLVGRALGQLNPSSDPMAGADHLLKNLEALRWMGLYPRQNRAGQTLDSLSGVSFGTNKRLDTLSGIGFGSQKRNFDEIDRSGFNSFVKKNFDEIDRSGFNSFVKRNFDEIDRSGFNSFVKRSVDSQEPAH